METLDFEKRGKLEYKEKNISKELRDWPTTNKGLHVRAGFLSISKRSAISQLIMADLS